jgi:hypothetical protein
VDEHRENSPLQNVLEENRFAENKPLQGPYVAGQDTLPPPIRQLQQKGTITVEPLYAPYHSTILTIDFHHAADQMKILLPCCKHGLEPLGKIKGVETVHMT